jgi:hypothetical protein
MGWVESAGTVAADGYAHKTKAEHAQRVGVPGVGDAPKGSGASEGRQRTRRAGKRNSYLPALYADCTFLKEAAVKYFNQLDNCGVVQLCNRQYGP